MIDPDTLLLLSGLLIVAALLAISEFYVRVGQRPSKLLAETKDKLARLGHEHELELKEAKDAASAQQLERVSKDIKHGLSERYACFSVFKDPGASETACHEAIRNNEELFRELLLPDFRLLDGQPLVHGRNVANVFKDLYPEATQVNTFSSDKRGFAGTSNQPDIVTRAQLGNGIWGKDSPNASSTVVLLIELKGPGAPIKHRHVNQALFYARDLQTMNPALSPHVECLVIGGDTTTDIMEHRVTHHGDTPMFIRVTPTTYTELLARHEIVDSQAQGLIDGIIEKLEEART